MHEYCECELTSKNKAILIARLLRAVGFHLLANYAERETSDPMLNGYLRIAEVKAKHNPENVEALAEAYYFGLLQIPVILNKDLPACPF